MGCCKNVVEKNSKKNENIIFQVTRKTILDCLTRLPFFQLFSLLDCFKLGLIQTREQGGDKMEIYIEADYKSIIEQL